MNDPQDAALFDVVTRETFWSWSQSMRDAWATWFQDHNLTLDEITMFTVGTDKVWAKQIRRTEAGRPVLLHSPLGRAEVDTVEVEIEVTAPYPTMGDVDREDA
jgi:hypothetical protein